MINDLIYEVAKISALTGSSDSLGIFNDKMNVIAIILALTGLGMVYFGIKMLCGYSFFPKDKNEVVVSNQEDFIEVDAKIIDDKEYEIPNYSQTGGDKTSYHELQIEYYNEGETYTPWISFGNYSETVKIKYNSKKPEEFKVVENEDFKGFSDEYSDDEDNQDDSSETPSKMNGIVVIIVGVLIAVVGCGLFYDYLSK